MKAIKTQIDQLSITFTAGELVNLKNLLINPIQGETPQQAILRQDLVLKMAELLA
jgi:hypothetical protein